MILTKRNLLIVSIIPDFVSCEDMLLYMKKFIHPDRNIKFLALLSKLPSSINDYIKISDENFKVYNRIIDYKPYIINSFLFLIKKTGDKEFNLDFWKNFLFSFVFGLEYGYRDLLYVPYGIYLEKEELDNFYGTFYDNLYFRKVGDKLEPEKCVWYIPKKYFLNFFDANFRVENFFKKKFIDVMKFIINS